MKVLLCLGNIVRAYSAERTLCEIMPTKVAADIQAITYAIKTYVGRKEKNIPKLIQLAKTFFLVLNLITKEQLLAMVKW
jgi:protein-tyrosine-phosphatase